MKKIIIVIFITFALFLCGCSGNNDPGITIEIQTQNNNGENETEETVVVAVPTEADPQSDVDIAGFKLPAELFKLDTGSDDISNDDIKYFYDETGRVTQCMYKIDGTEVNITYSYKENTFTYYAFYDDVLASYGTDEYPFDEQSGFFEYNGHYLHGFDTN